MPINRTEFQSAVQWIELPEDVTANILQRLGAEEILESAQKVCTTWRRVCLDPSMWRVIRMKQRNCMDERMPIMCRHAMDRSQGQLVDLTLQIYSDFHLLNYIIDRSSDLKRLTLDVCPWFKMDVLYEAVEKLPHLEELHLTMAPEVEAEDIINIGTSCPNLKSFTFNHCWFWSLSKPHIFCGEPKNNEWALAIAENMPNLCHLRLIDNPIDNTGLEAILDGCPKLESLDLSKCLYLDLRGALGKRCCEQIKHLQFPFTL